MTDDAPLHADQIAGAPHPRDTARLMGQSKAEETFLDAFTSGRMHHAWLLTGPQGIGKATLAYRIARFLIATPAQGDDGLFGAPPPPTTLEIGVDHPVAVRMRAGAEPGLRVIRRSENDQGRLRADIVVDNIRKLAEFFQLSAVDGGHRVVIVDSADEMNTSAANALLKMLEEPPANTTLLLISHQPSRLLPTIRSRCRTLRLSPLSPADLNDALMQAGSDVVSNAALAELSSGSVGAALRLINLSGLEIYNELVALMATMPQMDRPRARALADAAAQRGAEDKLALLIELIDILLARLARAGASGQPANEAAPQEAATFARLAPSPWAARQWATRGTEVSDRLRHGRAVNLDPSVLVLDTLIKLNDTARDITSPAPA